MNGFHGLNRIISEVLQSDKQTEEFTMKKTISILLTLLLIAGICITATAAGRNNNANRKQNATCTGATMQCSATYTDADNDGICDNRSENKTGANFVDVDNDGICDNKNIKPHCRANGACKQQKRNCK